MLHPEFDSSGQMLLGSSVSSNSLDYANAASYRPRFVSIPLPTGGLPGVGMRTTSVSPPVSLGAPPASAPPAAPPPTSIAPVRGAGAAPSLTIYSRVVRVDRRGRARVTLGCSATAPCAGPISLELSPCRRARCPVRAARIARGSFRLARGRRATVELRVSRSALRVVRRARHSPGRARAGAAAARVTIFG